jgi:hypothetical protein
MEFFLLKPLNELGMNNFIFYNLKFSLKINLKQAITYRLAKYNVK